MKSTTRVRFAPSPTGPLHIGGLRTALFNYLFAKKNNGQFILRIEDTDSKRFVKGAEKYICDSLNWAGLHWDEGPDTANKFGPYRQSERIPFYRKAVQQLINSGKAYYSFDTSESLEEHRKEHEKKGKTFIYNWHNRDKLNNSLNLDAESLKSRLDTEEYTIRLLIHPEGELELQDLIKGSVTIDKKILEDKILLKSDGSPTYHLANVVDDHLMQISHVIRGDEWLSSLPIHILLYEALGYAPPLFAHLPLILKPTGKGKLAKRDGAKFGIPVFPLIWTEIDGNIFQGFKESGYYPEALINALALLGWNPGTHKEIFSADELIQSFDLDRINTAPARFDIEKILWFNKHYLQLKPDDFLKDELAEFLKTKKILVPDDYLSKVLALLKPRINRISDAWDQGSFLFQIPTSYDSKGIQRIIKQKLLVYLKDFTNYLKAEDFKSEQALTSCFNSYYAKKEIGAGKLLFPLRVALTGKTNGPELVPLMHLLQYKSVTKRIENFILQYN